MCVRERGEGGVMGSWLYLAPFRRAFSAAVLAFPAEIRKVGAGRALEGAEGLAGHCVVKAGIAWFATIRAAEG